MGIDIRYVPIKKTDIKDVTSLYEDNLNSGSFMEEHILEGIESKDFVGYKAMHGEQMVGMFTGRAGLDFTYPHPELEDKIRKLFPQEKIYSPDSLVVLEEYRHHRVSKELGRKVITDVYAKGYTILVTELWIYPDGHIPADTAANQWGDVVYQEDIPGFYKNLEQYHLQCPICGTHCICGARIKILKVTEDTLKRFE